MALSNSDQLMRDLFNYRFQNGGLQNHPFGNLLLSSLEKITGSFEAAVARASEILAIDGQVIPVTTDKTNLCARLENGNIIKGETNIDVPKHDGNLAIQEVWLEPNARATKKALQAIKEADIIIIGPGDLYTSVLPNLLVGGIVAAIRKSRAKNIYICNLMTKYGETNGFSVSDFAAAIEKYLGKNVLDYIIYNTGKLPPKLLKKYAGEKEAPVKMLLSVNENKKNKLKYIGADVAGHKTLIRHDADRLARLIIKLG